jgi:hypothetical protein
MVHLSPDTVRREDCGDIVQQRQCGAYAPASAGPSRSAPCPAVVPSRRAPFAAASERTPAPPTRWQRRHQVAISRAPCAATHPKPHTHAHTNTHAQLQTHTQTHTDTHTHAHTHTYTQRNIAGTPKRQASLLGTHLPRRSVMHQHHATRRARPKRRHNLRCAYMHIDPKHPRTGSGYVLAMHAPTAIRTARFSNRMRGAGAHPHPMSPAGSATTQHHKINGTLASGTPYAENNARPLT